MKEKFEFENGSLADFMFASLYTFGGIIFTVPYIFLADQTSSPVTGVFLSFGFCFFIFSAASWYQYFKSQKIKKILANTLRNLGYTKSIDVEPAVHLRTGKLFAIKLNGQIVNFDHFWSEYHPVPLLSSAGIRIYLLKSQGLAFINYNNDFYFFTLSRKGEQ